MGISIFDVRHLQGLITAHFAELDEDANVDPEVLKAFHQQINRLHAAIVEDYGIPWDNVFKMSWTMSLGVAAEQEYRKLEQMKAEYEARTSAP